MFNKILKDYGIVVDTCTHHLSSSSWNSWSPEISKLGPMTRSSSALLYVDGSILPPSVTSGSNSSYRLPCRENLILAMKHFWNENNCKDRQSLASWDRIRANNTIHLFPSNSTSEGVEDFHDASSNPLDAIR